MTIFSGRGLTSIYTALFRMLKDECNREILKLNHSPLEDFTNCLWQKQPNILPVWIAYRLGLLLYFCVTFGLIIFQVSGKHDPWYKNFIFATSWTALVEILTFGLAFGVTLEKFLNDKKKKTQLPSTEDSPDLPVREKTPWHFKALWYLYNTIASVALSITSMFWLFIYDPKVHVNVGFSVITRIFNTVLFILDVFLNAIPFRFSHIYIPCIYATVYFTFTLIYQASGGTGVEDNMPIYDILDWRQPKVALSNVAFFFGCVLIFHSGICVISIFKNWLKKPSEPA